MAMQQIVALWIYSICGFESHPTPKFFIFFIIIGFQHVRIPSVKSDALGAYSPAIV